MLHNPGRTVSTGGSGNSDAGGVGHLHSLPAVGAVAPTRPRAAGDAKGAIRVACPGDVGTVADPSGPRVCGGRRLFVDVPVPHPRRRPGVDPPAAPERPRPAFTQASRPWTTRRWPCGSRTATGARWVGSGRASTRPSTTSSRCAGDGSASSTASTTRTWPAPCSTRPAPGRPVRGPIRASVRPASRPTTSSACRSTASTSRPRLLTLQNPPLLRIAVGRTRLGAGHGPVGLALRPQSTTALSERQRRTLDRIQQRARVRFAAFVWTISTREVGRFFEVYNAAWSHNWGFAPMPEAEIRHLASQLKQIINPNWAFGLETADGQVVGVCLALPDVNRLMRRVRSGRLLPFGWYPLLTGRKRLHSRPGLGPRRPPGLPAPGAGAAAVPGDRRPSGRRSDIRTAEASWTLATNHRINNQLAAMGAHRSKVWRLYQRPARRLAPAPTPGPGGSRDRPGRMRSARPPRQARGRKPPRARSMSCSVWVAMTEARSRAPGTAGGMAQLVYTPFVDQGPPQQPGLPVVTHLHAHDGAAHLFRHR